MFMYNTYFNTILRVNLIIISKYDKQIINFNIKFNLFNKVLPNFQYLSYLNQFSSYNPREFTKISIYILYFYSYTFKQRYYY